MMAQTARSLVLSLSLLATTMVSSSIATAAEAPATCLEAYRQASTKFMKDAPALEQTVSSSKWATGALAAGAIISPFTKAGFAGTAVAGVFGGLTYWANRSATKDLYRLANASLILSVYEDVLNNGGADSAIPEGQELLSQAGVDKHNEQAILSELVKRMESGKLCDKDKSPKDLGDIVAELKDFERTQVRGVF